MSWRTHAATGRAHAFDPRYGASSFCGLADRIDCAQELLPGVDERLVRVATARNEASAYVPRSACGLCLRVLRARLRERLDRRAA